MLFNTKYTKFPPYENYPLQYTYMYFSRIDVNVTHGIENSTNAIITYDTSTYIDYSWLDPV